MFEQSPSRPYLEMFSWSSVWTFFFSLLTCVEPSGFVIPAFIGIHQALGHRAMPTLPHDASEVWGICYKRTLPCWTNRPSPGLWRVYFCRLSGIGEYDLSVRQHPGHLAAFGECACRDVCPDRLSRSE